MGSGHTWYWVITVVVLIIFSLVASAAQASGRGEAPGSSRSMVTSL